MAAEDLTILIDSTMDIKNEEDKKDAREALCCGKLKQILQELAAKLATNPCRSSPYFIGDSITIADLQVRDGARAGCGSTSLFVPKVCGCCYAFVAGLAVKSIGRTRCVKFCVHVAITLCFCLCMKAIYLVVPHGCIVLRNVSSLPASVESLLVLRLRHVGGRTTTIGHLYRVRRAVRAVGEIPLLVFAIRQCHNNSNLAKSRCVIPGWTLKNLLPSQHAAFILLLRIVDLRARPEVASERSGTSHGGIMFVFW